MKPTRAGKATTQRVFRPHLRCLHGHGRLAPAFPWSVIAFPPGARQKKLKIVTAAQCDFRMKR
jgi:hypothetical protein